VGIFRRGKNADPADAAAPDEVDAGDAGGELDAVEGSGTGADDGARGSTGSAPDTDPDELSFERSGDQGPFDSAEVDLADDGRLDLGALRIRGVAGMELRLEIDEAAGQVVGATAVIGDSAVQIQAFAAPKTMGIWDDIRREIAESILAQGGTADEARGALGTELRTRMPSAGPDGRTVFAPARFAGVDGPRWFLRAVFSGRAAIEDEAAAPLLEVVRSTVVVRGDAAMAPREMLVLKLPEQPADTGTEGEQDGDDSANGAGHVDDLNPFERGPEITEIR
jgi:hypothetical protein